METKKILYIIAPNNFRDEEYFEPKEIFDKEKYEVTTASKNTKEAKGMLGGSAKVDIDIKDAKIEDYDAIVLAGGAGAKDYIKDKQISKLLKDAKKKDKLIAAICIAPLILANNNLLEGKEATVFDNEGEQSKELESFGATYKNKKVVEDEDIITANGPKAAKKFGKKIVKKLKQ